MQCNAQSQKVLGPWAINCRATRPDQTEYEEQIIRSDLKGAGNLRSRADSYRLHAMALAVSASQRSDRQAFAPAFAGCSPPQKKRDTCASRPGPVDGWPWAIIPTLFSRELGGLRRVTTLTKMAKKSLKQTRGPLDRREAPATHTKANWGPCQMQEQSRDPQADEPADSPWMLP